MWNNHKSRTRLVLWTCVQRWWRLTERQKGVFGVHEHQHPPQQVSGHDVVLDVVRVMLHAEGQQLQDQSQQLRRLEVIWHTDRTSLGCASDTGPGIGHFKIKVLFPNGPDKTNYFTQMWTCAFVLSSFFISGHNWKMNSEIACIHQTSKNIE